MAARRPLPRGVWAIADLDSGGGGEEWRQQVSAAGAVAWTLRGAQQGARLLLDRGQALMAAAPFLAVHGEWVVARALGADALILGARSLPWEVVARQRENLWLGAAVHDEEQWQRAMQCEVDFVVWSPVWPTRSKQGVPGRGVEALAEAVARTSVPVIALGGIGEAEQVQACVTAGAYAVMALGATHQKEQLHLLVEAWSAR